MGELDERLRAWRQELEATLAFSSEEIDELEDHLRLSYAARLEEGLAPEEAWDHCLGGLGSASALALEFAKDKLMPALVRLLKSWSRPALLLTFFGLIFSYSFSAEPVLDSPGMPKDIPGCRQAAFWIFTSLGFLATLILLPTRAQKNSLLAGMGNAFCLIPLLHVAFYNSLTEQMIGPGWAQMAASFGWLPISLSVVGLVLINAWWWKRSTELGEKFLTMSAVAGMLVLLLALSPFVGEWIGNLSIRDVYTMPTAADVTFTGKTLSNFLEWKFVDVLMNSALYIANILPFGLALSFSAGLCLISICTRIRAKKVASCDEVFPSIASLPWLMVLLGSGLCWMAGHLVEPPMSNNLREAEQGVSHATTYYGGPEIMVLFSAALYFICGWELTRRLARASRVRPFYAMILPGVPLIGSVLNWPIFPAVIKMGEITPRPEPQSAEPVWLSCLLGFFVIAMACIHALLIARKLRIQPGQMSLWKFEGKNLVELGLLLGLIYSGCWLILGMVANVLAFESVSIIHAMITWGDSIKDPVKNHFYPQMYGTPDHLAYWVATGLTYLAFCLAAGVGTVIVLSALEFIRFNGFRLYKVRKLRQSLAKTLALNE